jgi:leader peptidase (prepilin peptidase)/N-methyltransferase
MQFIAPLTVFLLGIAIGSFLTALLWRLRTRESFVLARSYCPSCRTTLGWKDLMPLVSFAVLGGKCRHCGKGISWQYPAIEMVTGLLFLGAFYLHGGDGELGRNAALLLRDWMGIAVLIAVFVFDYKYSLIPRALVLPTSIAVLFLSALGGASLVSSLFAAFVAASFFGLQYLVSNGRWIGLGDVTLGVFMGSLLGFSRTLVALFVAYILGAIVALVMLATKKTGWKSEIPFGTFLAIGAIAAMFFGERIAQWYLAML